MKISYGKTYPDNFFKRPGKISILWAIFVLILSAAFLVENAEARRPKQELAPDEGGGGGGSSIIVQPAAGEPLQGLTEEQRQRFRKGKQAFKKQFQLSDGVGPIFNGQLPADISCRICHSGPTTGGGGISGQTQSVVRFGHVNPDGSFDSLEQLGGSLRQLSANNINCREIIPPEANYQVVRVPFALFGFGLVDAIDDNSILFNQDNPPQPGISGRAHIVRALENGPSDPSRVGRFGWKDQMPTLLSFAGDASLQEMGITNFLFPMVDNYPNKALGDRRPECDDGIADPEDRPDAEGYFFLQRVTDFMKFLAPPPQTPKSGMAGEQIFKNIGCAACHIPSFITSNNSNIERPLNGQVIKAYSDFLLHDMGDNGGNQSVGGDGIVQGDAGRFEMRTAPLMGAKDNGGYLHNGSVSTLDQVMTHHNTAGSEAQTAAQNYLTLTQAQKNQLNAFLQSLGRREFDQVNDGNFPSNDITAEDFVVFRNCYQEPQNYLPDDACAISDINQDRKVNDIDLQALLTVFPGPINDCQCNGTNDLVEILRGTSADIDSNASPDECRMKLNLSFFARDPPPPGQVVFDHIQISNAQLGESIQFYYSFSSQGTGIPFGDSFYLNLPNTVLLGTATANSIGYASLQNVAIPVPAGVENVSLQAGYFGSNGVGTKKSQVLTLDVLFPNGS